MPDPDNIVFPGLKDRVVIITGAGQGIGRVLAKSFASAGARAVIAELNEKKAAAVSEEILKAAARRLRSRPMSPTPLQSNRWSRWLKTNTAASMS